MNRTDKWVTAALALGWVAWFATMIVMGALGGPMGARHVAALIVGAIMTLATIIYSWRMSR